MKKNVLLSIRGRQNYQGQDPDVDRNGHGGHAGIAAGRLGDQL